MKTLGKEHTKQAYHMNKDLKDQVLGLHKYYGKKEEGAQAEQCVHKHKTGGSRQHKSITLVREPWEQTEAILVPPFSTAQNNYSV